MKRVVFAALLMMSVIISLPAPAFAHAQVKSAEPSNAAQLEVAPTQIAVHFTESVGYSLGGVRVYNSDGRRVDTGSPFHPNNDQKSVAVKVQNLTSGSYVFTWRVESADSHPVQGASSFQIGDVATGDVNALSRELLANSGSSASVGAIYAAIRFAMFASIALLIGGIGFCILIWPAGLQHHNLRKLLTASAVIAALSSLASITFHGLYVSGRPLVDVVKTDVFITVLDGKYGITALIRAIAVTALLFAARVKWAAGVLSVVILASISAAGHASSGRWMPFAFVADVAHLIAMCIWLGGLIILISFVLRKNVDTNLTKHFSRVALWCVGVLVVTGAFQSYRQVGSIEALSSTYGTLLIIKVTIVMAIVIAAFQGRNILQRRMPQGLKTLKILTAWEAVFAIVVLVVTSLLVNATPSYKQSTEPFATQIATEKLLVQVTADPAVVGPNEVHIYIFSAVGSVLDPAEVTMAMSLAKKEITGLKVPLQKVGLGHYVSYEFPVPLSGDWDAVIAVRTDDVNSYDVKTIIPIR